MAGSRRITFTKLADLIGIHRHTLRWYLKEYGVYERFCTISDDDLDILMKTFKAHKPNSGLRYAIGFLRRHGLRVQRRRVRMAMRRVDGLGQVLRNHDAIDRQKYNVPHSNYLWHLDGHHKLIRWGFVIHGIVDGYCHSVSRQRIYTEQVGSDSHIVAPGDGNTSQYEQQGCDCFGPLP
jgi:hypothetical protein